MKIKFKTIFIVLVFLGIYYVMSWTILYIATKSEDLLVAYGLPILFGSVVGISLLAIFTHDHIIKIAKYIEKKEAKVEQAWLKRFARLGKLMSTVLIGMFGGPILGALTIKLLLPKVGYKYPLIVFINILSSLFHISVLRGTIGQFI